jgi:hypothetical protein
MNAEGLFQFVAGVGFMLCVVTGLVCAIRIGTEAGASWFDPSDIRGHWRGWIKTGLTLIAVGLIGVIVAAFAG